MTTATQAADIQIQAIAQSVIQQTLHDMIAAEAHRVISESDQFARIKAALPDIIDRSATVPAFDRSFFECAATIIAKTCHHKKPSSLLVWDAGYSLDGNGS